ncbi:mads box transcription factor mcm1 [Lichtheimia corymbifera JMRC:FSU:9682]|uniref:Mads box transcription factor mcm1 n=1 Tax=Lichtheimia corymbifera JMRC:FSU:9682 TaxID=1263082 RepID=A0A068S3E9_9FUNG|nr:mads box transcription factor mcm1 [Lichtheimia corymbifera JMRC:FSU:9682]
MEHEQQQPFQIGVGLNQQSEHDMLQPTSASPLTNFMPPEEAINEDNASDPSEDLDKPGKRSAGRRKIKIEYIQDKSKRHITFSKRKAGLMKKAYELSTLTGTQVLLLVVSETGLVYTFTTPKLQPLVTKPEGKSLIQSCLNAPDLPPSDQEYGIHSPPMSNTSAVNNAVGDTSATHGNHQQQHLYDQGPGLLSQQPPRSSNSAVSGYRTIPLARYPLNTPPPPPPSSSSTIAQPPLSSYNMHHQNIHQLPTTAQPPYDNTNPYNNIYYGGTPTTAAAGSGLSNPSQQQQQQHPHS